MATQLMTAQLANAETKSSSALGIHVRSPYFKFTLMVALSYVAMYILMYAMVNVFANVFTNINEVYMAALMASPMAALEIALMGDMYPSKTLNAGILVMSLAIFIFSWLGIRSQVGVGDQQFIRSMIPHHSGAILMCQEASLRDAQLQDLCGRIIKGQQDEIDEMKSILARLPR